MHNNAGLELPTVESGSTSSIQRRIVRPQAARPKAIFCFGACLDFKNPDLASCQPDPPNTYLHHQDRFPHLVGIGVAVAIIVVVVVVVFVVVVLLLNKTHKHMP